MKPLSIFIGYDPREAVAYHVLAHSIIKRATSPVSITPLTRAHLNESYTRKRDPRETTDFSLTRFLVPYLSGYEGISIYMDCDMLCLTNITRLVPDGDAAVWVCQHDYEPKTETKFLGQQQSRYPKKNWSSLMVFDNAKCRILSPEYVNQATPLMLHQLLWASAVGSLPLEWNWLVGEYKHNTAAKILHYTVGGPWFKAFEHCDYAHEWHQEFVDMTRDVLFDQYVY